MCPIALRASGTHVSTTIRISWISRFVSRSAPVARSSAAVLRSREAISSSIRLSRSMRSSRSSGTGGLQARARLAVVGLRRESLVLERVQCLVDRALLGLDPLDLRDRLGVEVREGEVRALAFVSADHQGTVTLVQAKDPAVLTH